MTVAKQADLSESARYFFDVVCKGEPITVPRTGGNVVVLLQSEYEDLQKSKRNAEHLAKLDRAYQQLERGDVVVKTLQELRAMENE